MSIVHHNLKTKQSLYYSRNLSSHTHISISLLIQSKYYRGPHINDINHFEIFDPSLPLDTHFTKYSNGVSSPFGRSYLPPKWMTSFMVSPLNKIQL